MGGCSVLACRNRFTRGKLHFYRFPKDARREIWIQFTRKLNFLPKGSSTICEVHFTKECFVEKKDRVHLAKDAVPTIFFKQSSLGVEIVQLNFDFESFQYFGHESVELLRGNFCAEDEETITNRKQERLDSILLLCRFCFCDDSKDGTKCLQISKLDSYNINLSELLVSLGLPTAEFCGDMICEQCFQQIVDIDLFKKKCQEAQEEICSEILELKNKIQEVRNNKSSGKILVKNNIELKADMEINADTSTLDILEEHLVDDAEFENVNYEIVQDNEEYIEEIHDGFKIVYQQLPENNHADDAIIKEIVDCEMMQEENIEVMEIVNLKPISTTTTTIVKPNALMNEISLQGVDEYEASTDDIIKNPERNRFCFRIYECFFCKMKFAGRKTYVAHKCAVSEVKCELCEKSFNRIQAYNSHMSHVHGSLPISKQFCPLCKTVIMATLNQFKQHRRQCNKNMKNQPIECEVCNKVCNNLKGYTIHKLFHDTRNFTTSTGEKIASEGLNSSKGLLICELCGKNFQSPVGYRMHKRNVHKFGQAVDETFQCDICSKICPTKRSLFDHQRNTHRIQEAPCTICGKIFRTKVLLKKHMMYHDETKRVYKCKLCPEKPGWFTAVALRRHQKSHAGDRDFHCDISACESSYTTNHQLKLHKANKHGVSLN